MDFRHLDPSTFRHSDDPVLNGHLQRIFDLAICRRNYDTPTAEWAARNLAADKPAYWFRGRQSIAGTIAAEANYHGSLIKALDENAQTHPNLRFSVSEDILDGVIPLNAAAIHEIENCYRLQSTFRDDLANRERDAMYDPYYLPAPYMTLATRRAWSEDYAGAQERFEARQMAALKTNPVAALAIIAAQPVETV